MTALTPQQMRELADEVRRELTGVILAAENEYGFDPSHPEQALLDGSMAALRTAADQLEAVQAWVGEHYHHFPEISELEPILTADTASQGPVQYNGHNGLSVFADATRRINGGIR